MFPLVDLSLDAAASLLEEYFTLFEEAAPLRINFEDLSGVLTDVPELALREPFRGHGCAFCVFAKSRRETGRDCILNKIAVNRLAIRRKEGFAGQCHLGVTDIVEPMVYKGRVLGVFYYGSVVLKGTEPRARRRIARYCAKRKLNPAPFLTRLGRLPRIGAADFARARSRLRLLARTCERIIEAYGLPMDRYRTEFDAFLAGHRRLNPLAQSAMRYVHRNYRNPIRLEVVAAFLKCHPDYLCRLMREQMGCGLGDYVQRVRIDHARRLITTGRFSFGEIAFQVGFGDQSYFNKVFRTLAGCTPGEYARRGSDAPPRYELGIDRPTMTRPA